MWIPPVSLSPLLLLSSGCRPPPAGPTLATHHRRPPARARPLPPLALGRSRLPASARPLAPRPPPPRPIAQTPLESGDSTRHDSSPSWRCCGTAAVWRDTATPSLLVRVSAFFLIADADSLVGPLAGEAAMLAATTYSAAVVDYVVAEHRHHHQASSPPGTSDATTATSVRVTGGEALPRDLQEVHRLRRPPRGPSTSRGCYGRTTRCRCSRQGTTVWGQRGAGGRSRRRSEVDKKERRGTDGGVHVAFHAGTVRWHAT
uniref:Uncharacterized protein n=1 Tax=Oryza rufipogon TaxID=4529 RepID=A0A0E0PZL7_ORYRU